MTDTPEDIVKKQIGILLSKTEEERFKIGDELSAFGRKVVESSIRQEIPGISEVNLKTEVFRRCFSTVYSPEEMNSILASMRNFLIGNNDNGERQ
jgi:hypothetical protein